MNNKNALIYGATGGLGRSIIKELKKEGVNIYVIGRSDQKLEVLQSDFSLVSKNVYRIKTITSDSDFSKVQKWLTDLKIEFHYAIHAAGQGLMKPAIKLELSEWRDLIDINLTSAFSFYKLFSDVHSSQGYEIVYFSSASLNKDWPKNSLYGASKSGLEAFAGSLQQEIKSRGGRVWLYRAGSINTGFFDRVKNHLPIAKMLSAENVAKLVVKNLKVPQGMYFPLIQVLND